MFRSFAVTGLAGFAISAVALTTASLMTTGPAEAFGPRYEREVPAYGWRPPPPAVHGYWGHRRWQRYNEGFRPPPPRQHYGYGRGYGWR